MKKVIVISVIIIAALIYLFYPEKVIKYPPGITAPGQPEQTIIIVDQEWKTGEFIIQALAQYDIKARVLSRNNFSTGKESELSPFDLALGWGQMSDQNVIDKIDISQSNRWYHWKADVLPIPARDISLNSANVHIIPKDGTLEKKFDRVYKGSLIEMKGYLVRITTKDGWHWTSSLRRDDTGGGSCELLWVDELEIFDK